MVKQCSSSLLMIRPRFFRSNAETISTNSFQNSDEQAMVEEKAMLEFDHVVNRLRKHGIYIVDVDNDNSEAPDAVFPNNWVSFHQDGTVIIYPMMAESRRKEKNKKIIDKISELFTITKVVDLSHFEDKDQFLEGTGSVIFDHRQKIAYAALSPRTNKDVLNEVCSILGYRSFTFSAFYDGTPIYHTNVLMHIGERYAIVCLDAIPDAKERNDLRRMLAFTGHEVVPLTMIQMRMFAGNMLEVSSDSNKRYTLLSSRAIRSLHLPEINVIAEHTELLSFDIPTIEHYGGGSIRCMTAEIFSEKK